MVAFLDAARNAAGMPAPASPMMAAGGLAPGGMSPAALSAILAMIGRGGGGGAGVGMPDPGAPVATPGNPAPANGPGFVGGGAGWGSGQIDLSGPWDDIAAMAAGVLLGPVGSLGAGLVRGGTRLNNAAYTDRARGSWGEKPLDFGQSLGAALGLNSYGGGGALDRMGEFRGTPVSPGGMVREGGIFGIGSDLRGAYTPGEAQRRQAAGRYGNAYGGGWSGNRGGGGGSGVGRGLNGNTSTGRVAGPV